MAQVVISDTSGLKPLSTDSTYTTEIETPQGESMLSSKVIYTANDSIVGSPSQGKVFLYNQAYVEYEDIILEAGYIYIDFDKNEVFAEGYEDSSGVVVQKPIFTEGDKKYRSDQMRYNFSSRRAKIKKVITQEGEGFLHGEDVKMMEDRSIYIKNASYTTCSHEHPHFRIMTPKAKVIPGEKVVSQFAYLEIVDVPTPLMVPFGFFPTTQKRKSGIIIPTYGVSEYRGYFLTNGGYYFAGNDYFDVALTGDIYSQGGYGFKAISKYNKRYGYNGNIDIGYNRIRYGEKEFEEFIPGAFDDRSDFRISWRHNQDRKNNPNFYFNANVNIASSNYYKVTSVNPADVLTNTLNSSVGFTQNFSGKPISLNIYGKHSQNNQTNDLTLRLPEVAFNVSRIFPFKRSEKVGPNKWYEEIGINYSLQGVSEIQSKIGANPFSESSLRDSTKSGIRHTVNTSANYKLFKNIVFSPSFRYNSRMYFQRLNYSYEDSTQSVLTDTARGFFYNQDFSTTASFSTKLYGMFRFKGKLRALRHVMTPTVGVSFSPDFSNEIWGQYQEIQTDSLGNTQRFNRYQGGIYGSAGAGRSSTINFGVQNTLEAKVNSKRDSTGLTKVKILERLSLRTSYNVAAEEFNWSPLNLSVSSTAFKRLVNMQYSAIFDFYGYDEELGTRVNEYASSVNGMLLRPTGQTFAMGFSLNSNTFKAKGGKKKDQEREKNVPIEADDLGITSGDIDYYRRPGYVDFNTPWSLNVNYNINARYAGDISTINQSVSLSGDVQLTDNWKVNFNTGYDLENRGFTPTNFNFYRQLHCWEMICTWVPFGFQQSYTLTIRVSSSILQDLKYERRRGVGDVVR